MQASIALHAGIVVDYDDIAGWWQLQDYTLRAFEAAVVLIRVAAQQTGQSVDAICTQIAGRRGPNFDHDLAPTDLS